jgi:UDPglucose 6-dehydrogenase
MNRIVVCGLGKLGSPLAAAFANAGVQVTGYDLDQKKVDAVQMGRAPVAEAGLTQAIEKAGRRLTATTDAVKAVDNTQACIFVAPTPSLPDGSFDNQYLLTGIEKIASAIAQWPASSFVTYYFVIASTVTPGSCENVLLPAIRKYSQFIRLVYKPELIALGTVLADLAHPDVALFGAEDKFDADTIAALYAKMQATQDCHAMTFVEAELAKISLNCAITMKISFANQVGMVATRLGANPHTVLRMVGADSRIGSKAMRYGMPFGGPCFPRDNRMFQCVAKRVHVFAHLAAATDSINQEVLAEILRQVPKAGDVGILGLSYKSGTSLTEESPGLALKLTLESRGRTVKAHDPMVSPYNLQDVLACSTVIVANDCVEYREVEFGPKTMVIDPMGVSKKSSKKVMV